MAVAPFPTKEGKVWQCRHCGCQTFFLHQDGRTECANCSTFDEGEHGWWADWVSVRSDDATPKMSNSVVPFRGPNGAAEALRFALNRVDAKTTAALIIIGENGRVTVWGGDFNTRPRRGWLRRRLEEARQMLIDLSRNVTS